MNKTDRQQRREWTELCCLEVFWIFMLHLKFQILFFVYQGIAFQFLLLPKSTNQDLQWTNTQLFPSPIQIVSFTSVVISLWSATEFEPFWIWILVNTLTSASGSSAPAPLVCLPRPFLDYSSQCPASMPQLSDSLPVNNLLSYGVKIRGGEKKDYFNRLVFNCDYNIDDYEPIIIFPKIDLKKT